MERLFAYGLGVSLAIVLAALVYQLFVRSAELSAQNVGKDSTVNCGGDSTAAIDLVRYLCPGTNTDVVRDKEALVPPGAKRVRTVPIRGDQGR